MPTVATWNVNSLAARLPLVLRYLETYHPDVLCLQETRLRTDAFPVKAFEDAGYHLATTGTGGYAGVAVASVLAIDETIPGLESFVEKRAPGRRLLCRIAGQWIDTVYVPTRMAIGKAEFLKALRRDHAARFRGGVPHLLAGDFNICFDARDYASPSMITDPQLHPKRPEDLALRELLASRLVDCLRRTTNEGGDFTWFPMTTWSLRRNYGMRLDYVFARRTLAARIVEVSHDRETRGWPRPSDHVPVRVRFER